MQGHDKTKFFDKPLKKGFIFFNKKMQPNPFERVKLHMNKKKAIPAIELRSFKIIIPYLVGYCRLQLF